MEKMSNNKIDRIIFNFMGIHDFWKYDDDWICYRKDNGKMGLQKLFTRSLDEQIPVWRKLEKLNNEKFGTLEIKLNSCGSIKSDNNKDRELSDLSDCEVVQELAAYTLALTILELKDLEKL